VVEALGICQPQADREAEGEYTRYPNPDTANPAFGDCWSVSVAWKRSPRSSNITITVMLC